VQKISNTDRLSSQADRLAGLGAAARALTLSAATLTSGLIAGLYYTYAVSVNLALAEQPDASYVDTMNAINERIQNPLFFASFLGAPLLLLATLAAHLPRFRSGRFRLVALACVLHIGGSFLVTMLANVPLNDELARVTTEDSASALARARAAYEGPWDSWNWVRTAFSVLSFAVLVGACLLRDGRAPRPGGRKR
jgi:uncharacterized membrane protein